MENHYLFIEDFTFQYIDVDTALGLGDLTIAYVPGSAPANDVLAFLNENSMHYQLYASSDDEDALNNLRGAAPVQVQGLIRDDYNFDWLVQERILYDNIPALDPAFNTPLALFAPTASLNLDFLTFRQQKVGVADDAGNVQGVVNLLTGWGFPSVDVMPRAEIAAAIQSGEIDAFVDYEATSVNFSALGLGQYLDEFNGRVQMGLAEFGLGDTLNDGARFAGTAASETLTGGAGNDRLLGGGGDDLLRDPNGGRDLMAGGAGDDVLEGGDGVDVLLGGLGRDLLRGQAGDDVMNGGAGVDIVRGGPGDDEVVDAGGGTVNDRQILSGDIGTDTVTGGDGADIVRGGAGSDTVEGGAGDDIVSGDSGFDSVFGGDGDDIVRGGADLDFVDGGAGNDRVIGDRGNDTVLGGAGDDVVIGGLGFDNLNGGAGNDILWGNEDADVFQFSGGRDIVRDYVDGVDMLNFFQFNQTTAEMALAAASQVGADVRFDFGGGDLMILRNVDLNTLDTGDFTF